jgi:tetratricopeptide (TPR) repeat protein
LRAIRESRAIAQKLYDPDDADSTFRLIAAIWREGLILGELNNINLGRPQEATPLLQRAFDLAEALARRDRDDYNSRSYVSMAGRELGDVLRETDPVRALAVYDHTIRRLDEVRSNVKARREQVWSLVGSSYALRRLGRRAEARQRIDRALSTIRELDAGAFATVTLGEEEDVALRALADHYADTGQTGAAIRTYEDLRRKVQLSDPQPRTDLRHANGISRIYRDLGRLYLRAGLSAEARALEERRIELWQYWDRNLSNNAFVRRQLSAARSKPIMPLL